MQIPNDSFQQFMIRTENGDYRYDAFVIVPDSMSDIEAWEHVQRHSPYTLSVSYDESNSSHVRCVADFSALRKGTETSDPEVYSPTSGWVAGWSWTWIIRN